MEPVMVTRCSGRTRAPITTTIYGLSGRSSGHYDPLIELLPLSIVPSVRCTRQHGVSYAKLETSAGVGAPLKG